MAMMRAQMDDLRKDARRSLRLERFNVPDDAHMEEINETVAMIEKAIGKERRKNRSSRPDREENTSRASSRNMEAIPVFRTWSPAEHRWS